MHTHIHTTLCSSIDCQYINVYLGCFPFIPLNCYLQIPYFLDSSELCILKINFTQLLKLVFLGKVIHGIQTTLLLETRISYLLYVDQKTTGKNHFLLLFGHQKGKILRYRTINIQFCIFQFFLQSLLGHIFSLVYEKTFRIPQENVSFWHCQHVV